MKVAVYSIVRGREKLRERSFASLEKKAGLPFDHLVHDNTKHNVGLQVASNLLLDKMRAGKYDYIVRFDDDIIVESDDVLAKMIDCEKQMGDIAMLSPRVKGLREQPKRFAWKKFGEHEVGFVDIIGGTCRLLPLKILDGFMWDVRMPMGIGETAHLCRTLATRTPPTPMAYIETLSVTHGGSTDEQEKEYPDYFSQHRCYQVFPYAPPV